MPAYIPLSPLPVQKEDAVTSGSYSPMFWDLVTFGLHSFSNKDGLHLEGLVRLG